MRTPLLESLAACLTPGAPATSEMLACLEAILSPRNARAPVHRDTVTSLQRRIASAFGESDRIALVYGGATRIKGYVFEAPRLPEIRGASAVLDWVNRQAMRELWRAQVGPQLHDPALADGCLIFASGGSVLGFGPSGSGAQLARAIEQSYLCHSLTANSVAVAREFRLVELAYGREPLSYWWDEFERDWRDPELRPLLASYYAAAQDQDRQEHPDSEARFFQRKTFGELVTLLATDANRRRESRGDEPGDHDLNGARRDPAHVPLRPWNIKCASSDVRAAVISAPTPEGDTRPLSEASAIKLFVGQRMKRTSDTRDWFLNAFGYVPQVVTETETGQWRTWEDRFRAYLTARQDSYAHADQLLQAAPALDMADVGAGSNPDRYVGLIFADGNNVGRAIAASTSPQAYQQLAQQLDQAAEHAVYHALATHIQPITVSDSRQARRVILPFEIITIGGDDMLLIVPGSLALPIAQTIAHSFEQQLGSATPRQIGGRGHDPGAPQHLDFSSYTPRIGLSAGVVIAPENTPIFFLRNLADELLKSAKKLARDHADPKRTARTDLGGAVDFMVLKSITMVTDSIAAFREHALATGDDSSLRLTARPYSWAELQLLLDGARQLAAARFPRSQLYGLRERLLEARYEGGIAPSVLDYLYTCTNGLKGPMRQALAAALGRWHGASTQPPVGPWLTRTMKRGASRTGYETVLLDLAEIVEFTDVQAARRQSSQQ